MSKLSFQPKRPVLFSKGDTSLLSSESDDSAAEETGHPSVDDSYGDRQLLWQAKSSIIDPDEEGNIRKGAASPKMMKTQILKTHLSEYNTMAGAQKTTDVSTQLQRSRSESKYKDLFLKLSNSRDRLSDSHWATMLIKKNDDPKAQAKLRTLNANCSQRLLEYGRLYKAKRKEI